MLAIGVDIGGTKIAAGVVDDEGTIIAEARIATPANDAGAVTEAVIALVRQLQNKHVVQAVGIGAAGFVDAQGETVLFAPNLAWRDYPLARIVAEKVHLDVVVENDANAAGWAEYRFGAARGSHTMLMLTLGTGLGGAIVVNGELIRGAQGFAAEVAHTLVVPFGHTCGCGQSGCLEQYTSGSALVRDAKTKARSGNPEMATILQAAGGNVEGITGPIISSCATGGDPAARELLANIGYWVGRGAASLSAVIDPDVIVVGGGVSEAGDLVLKSARDSYDTFLTAKAYRRSARIVAAEMANRAGIVGAADCARQHADRRN